MAARISGKNTTGALTVPDQHNPPPGYKAPIVCDGILDMRDVMVPMRDGKHLCVRRILAVDIGPVDVERGGSPEPVVVWLRSLGLGNMTAPTISGGVHHLLGKRRCPGWRWSSQGFAKPAQVSSQQLVFNTFLKSPGGGRNPEL